jgi:ABC-type Fe3+-hydroxamate transport system substrate-binding protein
MAGNRLKTPQPSEFIWLAPFVCIALTVLGLVRPLPSFAPPAHNRVVVDAAGRRIPIELPYRGTAITWWGSFADWYLEHTQSPKSMLYAGGPVERARFVGSILSWVYPEVLNNDELWKANAISRGRGPYVEVESLMAYNPGAYIGAGSSGGPLPLLRRVGLPVVDTWGSVRGAEEIKFEVARIESSLVGHPERGEAMISLYKRAFATLKQDVQPSTLSEHPRALMMGSSFRDKMRIGIAGPRSVYAEVYFPRAGLVDASPGFIGTHDDAERILAMDPDIVFLFGSPNGPMPMESPQEFMMDERWRGMKAVRTRRVYRLTGSGCPAPILVRWMAELAHPERMKANTREFLRRYIVDEYGYRLNDAQIDKILDLGENEHQTGYERFVGAATSGGQKGSGK